MIFMLFIFFFKQKTAYEMRISDWSSDVCSSDLRQALRLLTRAGERSSLVMAASKFVRLFVQIAVLAFGAALVLEQELSAGAMIAASIIMGRALAPLEQAIGGWQQAVQADRTSGV